MKRKYDAEEFLKDPEFIRWVRNPDNELSEFWNTFANSHPGSRPAMLKAREMMKALKLSGEGAPPGARQEILGNIVRQINENQLGRPTHYRGGQKRIWWRVAAAVVLLTGVAYTFYEYGSFSGRYHTGPDAKVFTRESPPGVKIQTRLPDGSSVWLNADTRLVYKGNTADSTRLVELSGEAFFEVKEDASRPFIVKTGAWTVKALGTSFNVKAYKTGTNPVVALLTGKVLVQGLIDKTAGFQLLPGERLTMYDNGRQPVKQAFNPIHEIGWKDGILIFDRADFEQVKTKLERWYGVTVHVPSGDFTLNWEIDGQYHNQSLERILRHLSYTKAFEFDIKNNEVFLTKTNP